MRVFIILSLLLALFCPATAATPQKPDSALIQRVDALQASVQRLTHQVDSLMIVKTQQERLLDATYGTLDRSIACQNTAATWVEILVGLIGILLLLFGAAVSFVWFREKKLLTEAKQIVTDIERLREDARKRVDEFKADIPSIQALSRISETERAKILDKVEGFERRLAAFEAAGGKLTAEDYKKRADSYYFTDRYEEAISNYDAALKIQPDMYEALHNKGYSLAKLGRREEAIQAYDAALKIKPDFHMALSNKGVSLAKLGRNEEAIQAYDAALKIKPDYNDALNNKGYSLNKLKRYEEAIQAFDTALKVESDLYEALDNKGISLAALGRYEEAIQAHNAALKIKPNDANTYYNRSCTYSLMKDKAKFLADLKHAIDIDSKNKADAKTDEDFKAFWDDPDFKKIVGE